MCGGFGLGFLVWRYALLPVVLVWFLPACECFGLGLFVWMVVMLVGCG